MRKIFLPSLVLFLGGVLAPLASGQTSTTPTFTTVDTNAVRFETAELLGTTATVGCSASTVAVTRTSGTVLSIANGSSATAPAEVRFGTKTRAATAALTLTISSGSATGSVDIYGVLQADGTLAFAARNRSTNVLALSAGTVYAANGPKIPAPSVLIYTWTITSGAFDVSGGSNQTPNKDCWLDLINLANYSGSSTTITITDAQGTVLNILPTTTIAANSTMLVVIPGGIFLDGGMLINAGATSSVHAHWRAARARQTPLVP